MYEMLKQVLMSPADYFGLEYDINAWMHQHKPINLAIAKQQWQNVYDIYTKQLGLDVVLCPPIKHLPDMVFATDCGLMLDGKMLLSNFRYAERKPETTHFKEWFLNNGYTNLRQAKHLFEGGGDFMLCGNKILGGFGLRSEEGAVKEVQDYFGLEVVPLKIVDPFFYHLDTSVAVLSDDTVAFYPGAIDEASQKRLLKAIPNVIEATLEEAQGFGLNAVAFDGTVVTSNESESLLQKFRQVGFKVIGTPILEFRKSGGGVKCMTFKIR